MGWDWVDNTDIRYQRNSLKAFNLFIVRRLLGIIVKQYVYTLYSIYTVYIYILYKLTKSSHIRMSDIKLKVYRFCLFCHFFPKMTFKDERLSWWSNQLINFWSPFVKLRKFLVIRLASFSNHLLKVWVEKITFCYSPSHQMLFNKNFERSILYRFISGSSLFSDRCLTLVPFFKQESAFSKNTSCYNTFKSNSVYWIDLKFYTILLIQIA